MERRTTKTAILYAPKIVLNRTLYSELTSPGPKIRIWSTMTKIKSCRFQCEVCHVKASIQVFYRKDGKVGYARARHLGANKKYFYHQQSIEYVNGKLGELSSIDPCQDVNAYFIEQNKAQSSSKCELEPSAGFGSATITLPKMPNH